MDIFGRNILKMSKPWVFTPSDKPPVLVYGAFVKSVVVLILMKIVTIVSTFISTFIDRNSEIGPNLRCLGHPPSRAEFASLFSLLEGGSPRAASGGVILIPRAPLHARTLPRLGSDSPGGWRPAAGGKQCRGGRRFAVPSPDAADLPRAMPDS